MYAAGKRRPPTRLKLTASVTLPCGLALFIFLPDYPANAKVFYLTSKDIELARGRCERAGTVLMTGQVDLRMLKRVLGAWRIWVIVPLFVVFAMSIQAVNYFGICTSLCLGSTNDNQGSVRQPLRTS